MLEKQPLLTKRYFVDPILAPLALFARSALPDVGEATSHSPQRSSEEQEQLLRPVGKARETVPTDDVEVDEKALSTCLDDIDKVLSASGANTTLSNAVAEGKEHPPRASHKAAMACCD
jgi:hypothetical protein